MPTHCDDAGHGHRRAPLRQAIVDLDDRKVLAVLDTGVVPVSTPPGYAVPDQTGGPEYVPPASPTTPPAEAPPDGSQDTSANWPAVTVWLSETYTSAICPESTGAIET